MTLDRAGAAGAALAVARRHPFLLAAVALAMVAALWLLVEVASGLLGWHGRGPEPLAPWMTVGYVGRAHGLDPRLIDATAGFPTPAEAGHALTLAEIAERQGVPVEEVMAEANRALAELRPERGHGGRGWPEEGPDGAPGEEPAAGGSPTGKGEVPGASPDAPP